MISTTPSAVSSAGRMRDVIVFRKPMGGESYLRLGIHALLPVVLVRSLAMGGKAAVGGGLVMGLLVGAAIVVGVVVLTPGPVAPTAPPTATPVTEASASPVPSVSSSPAVSSWRERRENLSTIRGSR